MARVTTMDPQPSQLATAPDGWRSSRPASDVSLVCAHARSLNNSTMLRRHWTSATPLINNLHSFLCLLCGCSGTLSPVRRRSSHQRYLRVSWALSTGWFVTWPAAASHSIQPPGLRSARTPRSTASVTGRPVGGQVGGGFLALDAGIHPVGVMVGDAGFRIGEAGEFLLWQQPRALAVRA